MRPTPRTLASAFILCFFLSCRPVARNAPNTDPALERIKTEANNLFIRSLYSESAAVYRNGLIQAKNKRDFRYMAWFAIGEGNCAQLQSDYRAAAHKYLEARGFATSARDPETLGASNASLASMYWRMGDLPAALTAFEQAVKTSGSAAQSPAFWLNLGILYSHKGDFETAKSMLQRGIEEAELRGDLFSAARGWNQLGWEYLQRGNLAAAEGPLIEGFRLRKMVKSNEMAASYRNLGLFRMARGQSQAGIRLLDESIVQATRNASGGVPLWDLYFYRGKARLDANSPGGLADLETAVSLARLWRAGIIPSESLQTGAGVSVHRLYEEYIRAAMAEYARTRQTGWPRKAFLAAEESRAHFFRQGLVDSRALTPEYWQGVAALRRAETKLLQAETPENKAAAAAARLRVMELEMAAGLGTSTNRKDNSHQKNENNESENTLLHFREGLSGEEALISFHVGDAESFVWAVTVSQFEVHRIPQRARVTSLVTGFRRAIRENAPDISARSQQLYQEIFGSLSQQIQASRSWLIVPDGPLFDLPFSALMRDGKFLPESISIRSVPSGLVSAGTRQPSTSGPFIGFGDPIYNVADSRWSGPRTEAIVELSRLPGSARELEVCARSLPAGHAVTLLTGAAATREPLLSAISKPVSILHLATHVMPRTDIADQNWIALGITALGEADFLTPVEIASSKYRIGLVSMTGCGSGTGKALPGAGLLGLARAWMMSGARAVAASLWPVRDDSGQLFQRVYRYYGQSTAAPAQAASEALRRAQLDMLREGGWRAEPRYWSAFFVAGKD